MSKSILSMSTKPLKVTRINKNRFDIFMLFTRSHFVNYFAEEIEYYSNEDATILGVLLFDFTDRDYNFVLMARDENRQFRAFDVKTNFEKIEDARSRMIDIIRWNTLKGLKVVNQRTEKIGLRLFDLQIAENKLHPYFKRLSEDSQFVPSKKAIIEISNHFNDIDGNFVEQFQSVNGFDSRLWEIYLFASLIEQNFEIIREHDRPDFLVKKNGIEIGIEAVTVGRHKSNPPKYFKLDPKIKIPDVKNKLANETPLKFSSSLHSKLKKKYWELPHMNNKLLIIAIADFHDDNSMVWSYNALVEYLYAYKEELDDDPTNETNTKAKKVNAYTKENGVEIPSGFFYQKDVENISGVLFSATGTISKFTRMGIQAGFGLKGQTVVRVGDRFNLDPNSTVAKSFAYKVDENCKENWSEGLNLFHNPNAKIKIDDSLFPDIANHKIEDGKLVSWTPEFHPFSSININTIFREM